MIGYLDILFGFEVITIIDVFTSNVILTLFSTVYHLIVIVKSDDFFSFLGGSGTFLKCLEILDIVSRSLTCYRVMPGFG